MIENEEIVIGKNVIENLTVGMYENSLMIYREYIQNAADSIDKAINLGILDKNEAEIDIEIDSDHRNIFIYDNALGIKKENFFKILSSIADSEKDKDTDKGFRGIGRLAGLAYCKRLIFTSSYEGEDIKSIMIWDGELLRNILYDKQYRISASELVNKIIIYKTEKCNIKDHFFEVKLEEISLDNDELLKKSDIEEYLSFVAPVPYGNSFIYSRKIYDFIKEKHLKLDEYKILLNGKQLFKPYKTRLLKDKKMYDEIKDVEFKEFYSNDGKTLLAWLWFAIIKYEINIPVENKMRSIRLRKENIQIGNERTLSRFFKESRGITYFIGELFVVNTDLIPNARRDYFNINDTLRDFEDSITEFFYRDLHRVYYYANKVKLSFRDQNKIIQKENEINAEGFLNKEEEIEKKKELKDEYSKLDKILKQRDRLKQQSQEANVLSKVYTIYEADFNKQNNRSEQSSIDKNICINNKVITTKKRKKYKTQELSKYSKKEQKLITRIYTKIKAVLAKDMADDLINKIQEDLKSE